MIFGIDQIYYIYNYIYIFILVIVLPHLRLHWREVGKALLRPRIRQGSHSSEVQALFDKPYSSPPCSLELANQIEIHPSLPLVWLLIRLQPEDIALAEMWGA